MKSVLAVVAAATPLLLAGPAHAATPTPGQVVFAYDPPQIAEDGSHVTWHWKLTNQGTETATSVTLLHHLTPPLDKVTATAPCTVSAKAIRCHYESVAAGASEEGTIDAVLPSDLSGTVQINGRITWQSAGTPQSAGQSGKAGIPPSTALPETAGTAGDGRAR